MTTTTPHPTLLTPPTTKTVPNVHPKLTGQAYRIAIIGEAPGAHEELEGRPFVGPSGFLLWSLCSKHGILRDACFVGNVCQVRPPGNKITEFAWDGPEIQDGLTKLWADLEVFKPNICVLLGNSALRAFTGHEAITNWRGSLILANGYKCLPSIHPASVLREYWQKCLLDLDLRLARAEGTSSTLNLPQRDIQVSLSTDEIISRLTEIRTNKTTIAIDIEGYWNNISCLGIAESPHSCFVINFLGRTVEDETRIMQAVAQTLSDPLVPKILQNSLYDTFCLQYGYSIPVRGVVDDTMLQHWELFCELPKKLSFLSSIYTNPREPYWKDERKDEDLTTRLTYCGKDCCVTYECRNVMQRQLQGARLGHYNFNLNINEPLLYMEQKGILYDKAKAQEKTKTLTDQIYRLQYALDSVAGVQHPTDVGGWVGVARDNLCFVRQAALVTSIDSILSNAKTTELDNAVRLTRILHESSSTLSFRDLGELATLTSTTLNVESKLQIADFLYRQLGLPVQYKKEHGHRTDKETTDVLAQLTLYHKTQDPVLKLILKIRGLRTRCNTLAATADPDGRVRCGYNTVGTETGRLTCYESPTGSGFNLQTVTKKDRDLFRADEGYYMFQCDLSGADGWTVAAHCYACGDPTMLEDYMFGLKPARNIAIAKEKGRAVLTYTRQQFKDLAKSIDPNGWLYFACKCVQHGTNYGMKSQTVSDTILKNSYKYTGTPIYVPPFVCEELQSLYLLRYPGILKWHQKTKLNLKQNGYIISANHHLRTFFGRRDDFDTFKQALADEPQNNTTFATNLALFNLWTDPDNRVSVPSITRVQPGVAYHGRTSRIVLRIQPLHQVHDALLGQFKIEDASWARTKIRTYFNNVLVIAGQKITIPFEGNYGSSWGSLEVGSI